MANICQIFAIFDKNSEFNKIDKSHDWLRNCQKIGTYFWNAKIFTELEPVQNLRIFSSNLMMFKIDLRELQTHWPIWSSKSAHHRSRFLAPSSGNRRKRSKFTVLFDPKPQYYAGEIPIGSDMIHVSGRDRKDDLKDDDLAPPKPWRRALS